VPDGGRYNIVSEEKASDLLSQTPGRFVLYLGAGASAEAGVPTASDICRELAEERVREEERNRLRMHLEPLDLDQKARAELLNREFDWDNEEERYFNCVRRARPTEASRVEYFRGKLKYTKPAFAHYASSLLMADKCVSRTALTTNFDKLLENAFAEIGHTECQAIRMSDEIRFWRQEDDKCYVIKLHGDYDTHNILNTADETNDLEPRMVTESRNLLRDAGMIVLGSAGREESIHKLMDALAARDARDERVLEFGLLWGVFAGPGRPAALDRAEMEALVRKKISEGAVGKHIVKLMERRSRDNEAFAFFPVWGCGSFLWNTVHHFERQPLIAKARQYLDHELRIGEVFQRKGLSEAARKRHIEALTHARNKIASPGDPSIPHEYVLEAKTDDGATRVWLAYGDIADEGLLGDSGIDARVKAIVSPEDTFLSIGGGAALAIAEKAGLRRLLNDLYQFSPPVEQGSTTVTSAGSLDVHYLLHAASVDVTEEGATTNYAFVKKATSSVLSAIAALGIDVAWIPLLGAGVANMSPEDSAKAIIEAVDNWLETGHGCTIVITVFREKLLSRDKMENLLREGLKRRPVLIEHLG
jgi:O-acetyl-ADP-ribose deacetylase (regulator of RNase III)